MTEALASEQHLRIRVYLEDTDAGGVVFYANYLRFMERVRTELLRAAGLQQSDTFQRDVSFVVHSLEATYLSPAVLDDELEVSCRVAEARPASIAFEQEVTRLSDGEVCCRGRVRVACISLATKRPRRIPPELLARIRPPQAP
jgi:tol-pal system-associated acyl-CoA thioesterase